MLLTSHQTPRKGQTRFYFDSEQFWEIRKELVAGNITFIEGTASLYLMGSGVKYLNKDDCLLWPTLENETIYMTPGEVARVELERNYGRPKNYVKRSMFSLLDISPPHYWGGHPIDSLYLYYVDLSGAYYQLYKWLTLDCVWPYGIGVLRLFPVAETLKDYKLARNAVVGITRSHRVNIWKNQENKTIGFHNPWFNPAIWHHIQAILHEIAKEALLLGCCYIATDGYIFTDVVSFERFRSLLDHYNLVYKYQHGEGYVTGWSSYKVGTKATKVKRSTVQGGLDNIDMRMKGGLEWLRKVRKYQEFP